MDACDRLPDAVRQLANRLGADSSASLRHVSLRQTGQMRENADAAWMEFHARQRIELAACAFDWKARTGPLGLISVDDSFSDGAGDLAVTLFGVVPIAGAKSSLRLDRGELMRYLAELAWAPDAIVRNSSLHWRALDDGRLVVAAGKGELRAEIEITLDSEGRIAEVFAADRPRAIANRFEPSAWRGAFSEYCSVQGRTIPMSAEVGWGKGSAYEAVWRGRVSEWRVT